MVRALQRARQQLARKTLLALVVAAIAILVTPSTAVADTGDRYYTKYCPDSSSVAYSGGPAHAKMRYCKVVWAKNIYEGVYWQTVSFQMIDSYTDGYCARAYVENANGAYSNFSECNGVWTTKTRTFNGRTSWINMNLNYGTSSSWYGISGGFFQTAPSGF